MNTDIKLKHYFSREQHECFSITLNPDAQLGIVCQCGQDITIRAEFVNPDTIDKCVEACKRLIAFYPEHTEQIEHILADFFGLAHSCTGNVVFAAILRDLGNKQEVAT